MSELKEEKKKAEKELIQSADASVDFTVKVESTDKDPYHKTGAVWDCSTKKAEELQSAGWVKIKK